MRELLRVAAERLLQPIARANRKGLDPSKPVLVVGPLGEASLPNGGTARV